TYLRGLGDLEVRELPFAADGRTDLEALRAGLGADTLCLVLGYPNVFGMVEDVALFADAVHAVGGLVITATAEPLALALVRSPGGPGSRASRWRTIARRTRLPPASRPRGSRCPSTRRSSTSSWCGHPRRRARGRRSHGTGWWPASRSGAGTRSWRVACFSV